MPTSPNCETGEKKGLTEGELKQLRARFKKRQNKFTPITGQKQVKISAGPIPGIAAFSSKESDDEEAFENADVEMHPAQIEEKSGPASLTSKATSSPTGDIARAVAHKMPLTTSNKNKNAMNAASPLPEVPTKSKTLLTSLKSSQKKTSLTSLQSLSQTGKGGISIATKTKPKPKPETTSELKKAAGRRKKDSGSTRNKRKGSGSNSLPESRNKKKKSDKYGVKLKKEVKVNGKSVKKEKLKDKGKKKKEKKENDKSREEKGSVLKTSEEKVMVFKTGEEKKGKVDEGNKKREKKKDKEKGLLEKELILKTPGEKELSLKTGEEKTDKTARNKSKVKPPNEEKDKEKTRVQGMPKSEKRKDEQKTELVQQSSVMQTNAQFLASAELSANIRSDGPENSESNLNSLMQSIEIAKKDQSLYEKMDDHIVLDTNVLQSIATDLTKGSNTVNKDIIGEDIANKLIEIEKKDQAATEQKDIVTEEEPAVVSEVAAKIVEALTSNQVLGKVLTPEEAAILKDYFSQKIPLSEKVLATLDTALDKILRRAHEFYENKAELDAFLKDQDAAKSKLLDALIAKKSNYLADLMTDASYYADRISKGLIDAYQLATKGILVARENIQYVQTAVSHTYRYSRDMAYRGAALTYETASRGKELAELGVSVGAQMTYDAANKGKEIAELSAAVGTKMTQDAAKTTCNIANKGREIAELSAAVGAKMTQDAASKGLQIAEETIQAAAKGTEMVASGLAAAGTTAVEVSGSAIETAVGATQLVGKTVHSVVSQAGSDLQKSGGWLLSFLQPSVPSKTSDSKDGKVIRRLRLKKGSESEDDEGKDDDDDDSNNKDETSRRSISPYNKTSTSTKEVSGTETKKSKS